MFHDGVTKLPDRNAVAGPGSKPWIVRTVTGVWHTKKGVDYAKKHGLDAFYEFWFPDKQGKALIFGFGYNWGEFGNDSGALAEFTGATEPILTSVLNGNNKDADPLLSEKAATVLNNMDDWTDGWVKQFNTWAEDVETGNEELEGETAELFAATLQAVKRSLQETYAFYLNGEMDKQLTQVSKQLNSTVQNLRENATNWFNMTKSIGVMSGESQDKLMNGSVAMAFTHLYASFLTTMATIQPMSDYSAESTPINWGTIESWAKKEWTRYVVSELDEKSVTAMKNLAATYESAAMVFSDANAIVNKTFTISLTADEQKEFYGSTGPGSGSDDGTGGTNDLLSKFQQMFGGGAWRQRRGRRRHRRGRRRSRPGHTAPGHRPERQQLRHQPSLRRQPPEHQEPPPPSYRAGAAAEQPAAPCRCPPDHGSTPRRALSPTPRASRSPGRTASPWSCRPGPRSAPGTPSFRRKPVSPRARHRPAVRPVTCRTASGSTPTGTSSSPRGSRWTPRGT